jgi:hypothetical protein
VEVLQRLYAVEFLRVIATSLEKCLDAHTVQGVEVVKM